MAVCSSCGSQNPDGFNFCGNCGSPLDATPARSVAEERKIVTALFCDLVAFTDISESADPEEVDSMLADYFEMARAAIEAYGGTVEKFIGDAVVGVFGAPAAHEDDAERAVRAGLRIAEGAEGLEAVDGEPLRLRVGINTGEALVRLGVAPASGEGFLRGDAINTASRIQSVAPEMGVAVGLGTYETTANVFDYEELGPATLKGKSAPVRVFRAKSTRARFGTDLIRTHDTPFVGREIDLALLKGMFDKTVAASLPQLVTVVGEPGLGKSRIVAELFGYIETKPDLITWRQGRCLPYGEGVTFWALGEILKAHAGVLESDGPDISKAKLERVLPDGEERPWFRQRLLPLLGIEATSTAERDELFNAWRRYLEHIAERNPTVLVFEDLHWADEAMLAFLEHLADRAEGVALLVVGTARPELFERHRDYGAGMRNANTIDLGPLSEAETARLLAALLETTALPAELQQPILERAEGNPLYAEEFVRFLKDKDLIVDDGLGWTLRDGAEVPFPDSIQALIASRLDTLSTDTKSMLSDAAVIGKVFWAGAVAQMGERGLADVTETLRELSRKELIRAIRRSSIEGEAEYAFWHVLARDVAYGQLPRASRQARHVAAARWIESRVPERVEDVADVLAYHYATALELAKAADRTDQVRELEEPSLRFLSLAGERALGLDTAAAFSNFERALALTPPGHPRRADALARFGEASFNAGHLAEATRALDEAIAGFQERGDPRAEARALFTLALTLRQLGDPRAWLLPGRALGLLETLPPGPELVRAVSDMAFEEEMKGDPRAAIDYADRAIALAEESGLGLPARAYGYRGLARTSIGDREGFQDFRHAIELATLAGHGREVAVLRNNLGLAVWGVEGPDAALAVFDAAVTFAEARGLAEMVSGIKANTLDVLIDAGDFDRSLEVSDDLANRLERSGGVYDLIGVRGSQARIMTMRGEARPVIDSLDWLESNARTSKDPTSVVIGLGASAMARAAVGQDELAAVLLAEVVEFPGARAMIYYESYLPGMVRAALAMRASGLAERLVAALEPHYPHAEHALVAANAAVSEAHDELQAAADSYGDVADRWERLGVVPEQAFALLGQGRCLVGLSHSTDAAPILQQARETFAKLKAGPALDETEALLHRATARRS